MAIHAAEPSQPVLLIADSDPDARAETVSALVRRFGRDYQVLSAETAHDGLDASSGLQVRAVRWHSWRLICGCPT